MPSDSMVSIGSMTGMLSGCPGIGLRLSGEKSLNQDILINDQTISAGATTQTGLSFNIYRLLYNYSFYRNDKVELAVSPGLYMMKTNFNFAGQGTINGTARYRDCRE